MKLLLDTGRVEVDSKDMYDQTPLSWAAENGQEATVKLLLNTGNFEVDSKDIDGWTPLLLAARKGQEATVKLLLDTGKVNIDSKDMYGRTPLSWAAGNGHEAIVKQLLGTGKADVVSKNNYGRSPLSFAAQGGHQNTAMLLLGKMPEVVVATECSIAVVKLNSFSSRPDRIPDALGRTPPMWAALGGHVSFIQSMWSSYLSTPSSTTMDKDSLGLMPIHLFTIGNCSDGISLILDAGCNVNEPDFQDWTPLHWAAYFGYKEVVELLLCRGADKSCADSHGWTAYQLSLFVGANTTTESLKNDLYDSSKDEPRQAKRLRGSCDACTRVGHVLTAPHVRFINHNTGVDRLPIPLPVV